ncbi:unnamed protein product [Soboliphyme baturini]|uniref:alpha-L-fucosidase n=1 Tax=Soboliphyme baturini TaxID=241478 RepID=A0A183IYW8_9BILA|nr:unnamed protein product [Soboliphyme baturini]
MNVGPTHDGRIIPIFEERLTQMGQWLAVNGEAVYGSKPWIFQNDTVTPNIWYTSILKNQKGKSSNRLYNPQDSENTIIYAFMLKWPEGNLLKLGAPKATENTRVSMLGSGTKLKYEILSPRGITIDLTETLLTGLGSKWSWVIKMEQLASESKLPVFDNRSPAEKLQIV